MPKSAIITKQERSEIEILIKSFDNHGCGMGLDAQAQGALRRLLDALEEAEGTIERYKALAGE